MQNETNYELIAIFGPDRCPNCGTELITRAVFSNDCHSLLEISDQVSNTKPWIDIPFDNTTVVFCPYCK